MGVILVAEQFADQRTFQRTPSFGIVLQTRRALGCEAQRLAREWKPKTWEELQGQRER